MTRRSASAANEASPGEMLALDRQLCFALYSTSLVMTKLYKPLLAPLELTYPQYLVMLALWEQDAVTVSELGQRLGLDSGTLTPLLKRLEEAGRLSRDRDSADERRVLLSLTPAGRALKAAAAAVPQAIARATACELGEITGLTRKLQSLRTRLAHALPRAAA